MPKISSSLAPAPRGLKPGPKGGKLGPHRHKARGFLARAWLLIQFSSQAANSIGLVQTSAPAAAG